MDDLQIRCEDRYSTKLVRIQSKLKAPKNQYNNFGKYSYRSCEDILEAVKPLLAEENVALVLNDEIVEIGNYIFVKATACLWESNIGNSKSVIASCSSYAGIDFNKKGMDAAQVVGSSSSYARKYALNGLFLIDDNKDSDYPSPDKKKTSLNTGTNKVKDSGIDSVKNELFALCKKHDEVSGEAPGTMAKEIAGDPLNDKSEKYYQGCISLLKDEIEAFETKGM